MVDIYHYNGSAVIGMAGKNCVGIASDTRLGVNGYQTVSTELKKIYQINDFTFLGCAGLVTDVQSMYNLLRYKVNLYKIREERDMQPDTFTNLVANTLYSRRFASWFVTPIVAGLKNNTEPYLSTFDHIGAICSTPDFVVAGTCSNQLYGVCESLWKENMDSTELFETLSQCLLAGVDRDCFSGWGASVSIVTPDNIITKKLKTRMD